MNNPQILLHSEPKESLYTAIISRISLERIRSAKRRLWYGYALISASAVALMTTVVAMVMYLSQSGFYTYFSLAFSDSSIVLSSRKEFALSLIESFSVSEFILLLAFVLVTLVSVRMIIKNMSIVHPQSRFAH